MLHKETIMFSWETPEFETKTKRKDWYWIVGIVAVVLIILALILKNYLFAFLIGIGAFLMIHLSTKEPLPMEVQISKRGIKIHENLYTFESMNAFWIKENKKQERVLLILSDQETAPLVSITINEMIDVMELREFLLEFVEEREMTSSLTDRIIDKIGF